MTRPCSMAETMLAKLSSVRTMSAVCLATSVPVIPMAMPMFARLSAGASFTPSPVIATTWSRALSASTMRVLCCGETRQHTSRRLGDAAEFLVAQPVDLRAGQHQSAGVQQADVARDGLGGVLVVAGHHDALQTGALAPPSALRSPPAAAGRSFRAVRRKRGPSRPPRRSLSPEARPRPGHATPRTRRASPAMPRFWSRISLRCAGRKGERLCRRRALVAQFEDDVGRTLDDSRKRRVPEAGRRSWSHRRSGGSCVIRFRSESNGTS